MTDPTQCFTNRIVHYLRYRPSYPRAVLELLERECTLTSASTVGDVGSRTGILSELFLRNGNRVIGIEPNREMREAAEHRLGQHTRFTSVAWTAEATTLDDASVDFVTAGQAFHWFDPERAQDGVRPHSQTRRLGRARMEPAAQRRDAVPRGLRAASRTLQDGRRRGRVLEEKRRDGSSFLRSRLFRNG